MSSAWEYISYNFSTVYGFLKHDLSTTLWSTVKCKREVLSYLDFLSQSKVFNILYYENIWQCVNLKKLWNSGEFLFEWSTGTTTVFSEIF